MSINEGSIEKVAKNRALQIEEVRRLVASDKAATASKQHHDHAIASMSWPGSYNMRLLAEAVNKRREFVEFEPYARFAIRYDSPSRAVFIKPDDGSYAPCGWFTYDKLKEFMDE